LVFSHVDAAHEKSLALLSRAYAGIMAGGNFLRSKRLGIIEQNAELYVFVADNTGIGRSPPGIFFPTREQNDPFEGLMAVQHVVMNTEAARNSSGLSNGLGPAAGQAPGRCMQSQGDPYDVKPPFKEERSRDARINPAAHGRYDTCLRTSIHIWRYNPSATTLTMQMMLLAFYPSD
jgi:hypothetical protein